MSLIHNFSLPGPSRDRSPTRPLTGRRRVRPPILTFETLEQRLLLSGLVLFKDVNQGTASSDPHELTVVGESLFFVADDGTDGAKLWRSDGTGTALVKEFVSDGDDSDIHSLTALNDSLFFTVFQTRLEPNAFSGSRLWNSDGTEAGTEVVLDVAPLPGFPGGFSVTPDPENLTIVGNTLYFTAFSLESGVELWKSDGTSGGTGILKDITPGSESSTISELTAVSSRLFFVIEDPVRELWTSDGTAAGTRLVKEDLWYLTAVGDLLYFTAANAMDEFELWKTDGTEAGTALVKHIPRGDDGSAPSRPIAVGNTLFFVRGGNELWTSDGSEPSTVLVRRIDASFRSPLTVVGQTLFFTANDQEHGTELWRSDGTPEGTTLVRDIRPGVGSSALESLTVVNETLYFAADDGVHGVELWQSDGTSAGTVLVQDLAPGESSTEPTELTEWRGSLYFTATTDRFGDELWNNNAPPAGVFEFSAEAYVGYSNSGTVEIVVSRLGGSEGTASVSYATSNGSATAGSDYVSASGTLNFADGETSKSFSVTILKNPAPQWDETINLTLHSPTGGAILGEGQAAVMTVGRVPALSSNPGAPATLVLDFDGYEGESIYCFNDPRPVPPYDSDGDPTTFAATELDEITNAWRGVARNYAIFNINVTTVPTSGARSTVFIGGGYDSNCFDGAAGVGEVGGHKANALYAEVRVISHEAGHNMGLHHQSVFDSEGNKVDEYSGYSCDGFSPIMGVGASSWWRGPSRSATDIQDDMDVIAGTTEGAFGTRNTFGYRLDDHGNNAASATALTLVDGNLAGSGIIGRDDEDYFSFSLATNQKINFKITADSASLRPTASLFTATGTPIQLATQRVGLYLTASADLPTGDYRLRVAGDEIRSTDLHCTYVNGMRTVGQYTIGPAADPPSENSVQFGTSTVSVGEKGKTASILVVRQGDPGQSATARITIAGGSATLGSDYNFSTSVVTFAAGQTSRTVTVSIKNDRVFEGDETVQFLLSDPVNAGLGDQSTVVLTIQDDERGSTASLPVITFNTATPSVNERDGVATITVNLSAGSDRTITVGYATGKGSAKAPVDFARAVGTLTFAPGQTSQSFTIQINNDAVREPTETLRLKLSRPTNAKMGTLSNAVLSVLDDD